jgi:hypothetical protein
MRGCWQGEVDQILEELAQWQARLGEPPTEAPAGDPREILRVKRQYLRHNRPRMNYPEYRRQGLPVTTAWMESLVKEVNWRVKGTEMFWNNPEGAEAILRIRAASDHPKPPSKKSKADMQPGRRRPSGCLGQDNRKVPYARPSMARPTEGFQAMRSARPRMGRRGGP